MTPPLETLRSPDRDESYSGRPLRRLRAYLADERRDLWVVVLYSVGVGLFTLVVPVSVQALVNTIALGSLLQPLVVLTLLVLIALGFSAVMNAFRVFTVEILQRRLFVRVVADFTQRLLRVRAETFDRFHGPELVNRFFDVVTVQKSAGLLLMDGLSLIMQTLLGLILLAVYHPLLLIFDVLLIAVMSFIIFVLGRGAIPSSIDESKTKYAVAAWLEEIAEHVGAFKSTAASRLAIERADQLAGEYVTKRETHFKIVFRQIFGALFLQAIASASLLGIGGFLVMQGQLTLGQLVAAELIVTVVVSGFSKFGKKLETVYDLLAALDKLGEVIDLPLEKEGGGFDLLPTDQGASVSMREVGFSYADSGDALVDLTMDIAPGERVGVMGPSGGGKSTVADIVSGLRRPTSGVFLMDGLDTRALSLVAVRDNVAIIRNRNFEIFTGTALDNIVMGRQGISLQDVHAALEAVGLMDDILDLPEGLQTQLRVGGGPLTAGQAERMLLVRAIISRPRLIVIDNAFQAAEDTVHREQIVKTLFSRDTPWSLLIVTDSTDLLDHCDTIWKVSKGEAKLVRTTWNERKQP